MKKDDGIFKVKIELDRGTYQYKLHIDGYWFMDMEEYAGHLTPAPSEYVGDGFGGQSAVIQVI